METMTSEDVRQEILSHSLAGSVLKPLMDEHLKLEKILLSLKQHLHHFEICYGCDHCDGYKKSLLKHFKVLTYVELHHAKEENILHTEIEKKGVFGTQSFLHAAYLQLQQEFHDLNKTLEWNELPYSKALLKQGKDFIQRYLQLVVDEELSLYTTAIDVILDAESWERIKEGFEKIGYHSLELEKEDEDEFWTDFAMDRGA